jgi:class 3 adenylate cyclase
MTFDRALFWLAPHLLLKETPYQDEWFDKERVENTRFWRFLFPAIGFVYLGHYYLFDLPQGLQPPELWFRFRMTIVALCALTTIAYFVPSIVRSSFYRMPCALTILICCYTQARTIVWYDHSQYLYALIYVVVGTTFLRTTVLASVCYGTIALVLQWPSFVESGTPVSVAIGSAVATLAFIISARATYANDVRLFVESRRFLAAQKRVIEMNIEFSDRIRAFLPKEISTRLGKYLAENRLTVLQAVDRVLAPTPRQIACLFVDLGKLSGQQRHPNVRADSPPKVETCSRTIEEHGGIPRKVGDLMFAYFDDVSIYSNLVRCLMAALELANGSDQHREFQDRRGPGQNILVSTGRAIVGNIGGYESSIEITALGSPVNLLSRIREVTKTPQFSNYASNSDIVVCPNTAKLLEELQLPWRLSRLKVTELGTRIRDFEEIDSVWVFAVDTHNRRLLLVTDNAIRQHYAGRPPN